MEQVDPTDPRIKKANEALVRFDGALAAFRENKQLSDEGKRRGAAQAWVSAADAIRALKEDYLGEAARQKKALEEKLVRPPKLPFGATASEAIARDASFRDALDRAEKAEDPEALAALLRRAEKFGDPIQVRAVVAVALERGDVDTINVYAAAHPEEEPDLQALFDVSGDRSLADRVRLEMVMPEPQVPGELNGFGGGQLNESVVRRIAAGDTEAVTT